MYSTEITQRIITYIIFLLCFLIAYLSFWSPFINRLCDEIWRTRSMLTLIPYDICKNIQSIKHYLSQQDKDSSKQGVQLLCQKTFSNNFCLLYTSPSPRDLSTSRMPSSA
eukprot:TRINITY_DN5223_c0_g1_i1.p2 TRINITY_DN5223_c0_g1~~TRINITY_DN5223_c0_g1_i1.p2  ORF type:complete len:110 (+),score=6.37 TRINITY_DN5223_c0_g1_i1:1-330(+)